MSVEELLRPRYKVIADYPHSYKKIGDILFDEMFLENGSITSPEKYPAIFRKLEWWQERSEKDMPEYLKETIHQRIVIKISQWVLEENICFISAANAESRHKQLITQLWLPATEQEYLNYIKQNQQ